MNKFSKRNLNVNDIHTSNDLLIAASVILDELNLFGITKLIDRVKDWCQTEEETNAQLMLLHSIEDSIEEQLEIQCDVTHRSNCGC